MECTMLVFDRYMHSSAKCIERPPFSSEFDEVQVAPILTEHFLPEVGKYFLHFVIALSY